MSGNEKLIKKNQLRKPRSHSGSTPTQPKTATKKLRSSSLSESDASSISSQLELNVTPQAAMPAIQHSHRVKDKCPCNQSLESSWKLDCAKCGQFWHANCVGLNGLNRKMLNDLTQWPCPFCFVSPIATISTEVEVCHVCRNTLSLQQTNLELETAHISSHIEPLANCCKLIKDIDFVEFSRNLDTLSQFDAHLQHLLLKENSLNGLNNEIKLHDKSLESININIAELQKDLKHLSSRPAIEPSSPSASSEQFLKGISEQLTALCANEHTAAAGISELKQSLDSLQPLHNPGPCIPPTPLHPGPTQHPRSPVPTVLVQPPHHEQKPVEMSKNDYIDQQSANELRELFDKDSGHFKVENDRSCLTYGERYDYPGSKSSEKPQAIPPALKKLIDKINNEFCQGDLPQINSCLVNRFEGTDSKLPRHSDDEPTIHPESKIFTVSLGSACQVSFSDSHTGTDEHKQQCEPRSLYVMTRRSQALFNHRIDAGEIEGLRYSITLRSVNSLNRNATCIIGDSNTGGLRFGTDPAKSFGKWLPGKRIFAPVIDSIDPYVTLGYKNCVILCGVNDLKNEEVKNQHDIEIIYNRLALKIAQIQSVNPCVHVFVCPAIPSKLVNLNRKLIYFNSLIRRRLLPSNFGVSYVDGFDEFCDRDGLLDRSLSRDLNKHQKPDFLHLNWRGLAKLGQFIRNTVLLRINGGVDKRKRRSTKVDDRSYRDATAGRETGPVAARAASPGHVDGYQPES